MQNFSNSPVPPSLPLGFSGRSGGGGGGPAYPSQPAEPQISPRMTDDYMGIQQQSLHRGHHSPAQASHMLAYSARNRVSAEPPPQGGIHSSSSNNPYRKDVMDYYFSMGAKDRHRRGGLGYGVGFGYPNIDGHIPHQYRHTGPGSAASSGLMSPYPLDYASSSSSGGGAGVGAFSPSQQYNMSQNPAMQSVPGPLMHHRQHGQTFHPGQQHRGYPQSGHRMTPQYPHYSPQGGTSAGSSGMYSPPPQRYLDGTAAPGFDPKVNSSPSVNSSSNSMSSSVAANNVGPMEHVQQGYHAPNYPGYSPQSLSLHKQAALQHRSSQHSLGLGYDPSVKMQHQGPTSSALYAKHHQASNLLSAASQELAKSPLHPNTQQNQMNQNFSPISNPSPAASAVHSPSCSSSPSPLMGVTDPHGNPTGHGLPHPHSANPRSNNAQGRLLQSMPQLSPTPNSNGSISSCGSGSSHKAPSMSALGGSNHPPTGRNKMGLVTGIGSREDASSIYSSSPLDKMQDAGLNSLNALSSQVANLPNTVQHMLLTDTVFSQKKVKELAQLQQATHSLLTSQPRSRNASAASSTSTVKEGSGAGVAETGAEDAAAMSAGVSVAKVEREEQFPEGERGRVRQMSGTSSGSEPAGHRPPSQTQSGQSSNVKTIPFDSPLKETGLSEANSNDAHVPSLSSPLFGCQSSEAGQASHSTPPVSSSPSSTTSSIPPALPNCDHEPVLVHKEHRGGRRKLTEIKTEGIKKESDELGNLMQPDREVNTQNGQDRDNGPIAASRLQRNEREEKHTFEEHNTSGVGVIVSARSEGGHCEKGKHPQDCIEGKQPHSYLRESSSHNGEEGVDLTLYSSHHQKSNFSRNSQNPPQPGSNKFGHPESTYGSDLPAKNRGRGGSAEVMESNSRYSGYQQAPSVYGTVHHKDSVAEDLVKRGHRAGSKVQEENSQSQHFPSLLQEVLQGCNLDRRYGRPEQPYSAHPHAQQQFQARNAYDMTDSIRVQSGVSEALATQMGSGKPPHPNQRHGTEPDFNADPQSIKTELSSSKMVPNAEKPEMSGAQSHLSQSTECDPPHPKHVNLSTYSLPHRKALFNASGQSSAVQELLLHDTEPVTCSAVQPESQKASGSTLAPSERRSVICDVSPNRHDTPERDREGDREREKSHSGASVIQQPFSSPAAAAAASDLSKKVTAMKHVVKMEIALKDSGVDAAPVHADHRDGANEADPEFHSKSVPSSVVMNADPYRRGSVEFTPMSSHPLTSLPLSSPSRTSYLHGVEISAGGSRSFPSYRYSDTRDGSLMPRGSPHFSPHHAYHNLSAQTQPGSKLQTYTHARGTIHHPPDMSDWVKAMNRPPKEMIMQPGSSPGKHKGVQSEQRQRLADMPVEQLTGKNSLHHQSSFFDLKMWESTHVGREAAMLIEGNPYYRTPALPPPVAPLGPFPPKLTQNAAEPKFSRGAAEDVKLPCALAPLSSTKTSADTNSTAPQVQRQTKTGSADTNPLMLRRRVRSFISPIPAKRLLQDGSQQKAASNSHHPVGAQSEHGHHNEDDSSCSDVPCPRLSSPLLRENNYSQPLSPLSASTKPLPPRKGRGLKLEAIVQKITPNIKRPSGHTDDESNHYPGFSHSESFNESQEQDLAPFTRVAGGDDGYMEDSSLLNDMIPFRVSDETGPLPPSTYPCDPHQASQTLKQDFDFGLGAAVASASGDKEDFALLGPLPPPPPLPRPVQGSPPPSSSALSDIEHFTNTYQQLETRRGEHSAANLLRQKLQESGMGFDDYPGSEYYGATPPHHGQPQGHILSRHQMPSVRSSLSPQDSKPPESLVPKGYFPSGKKKGRPVGSVNKQKRAQNPAQTQMQGQAQVQAECTNISAPPIQPMPPAAPVATVQTVQAASSTPDLTLTPPMENKLPPQLAPPILTQVVKVDVESEDTQPEIDVKPARRRRKGIKDEDEPLDTKGQQGRRRKKAAAAKEDAETARTNRVFADPNRKGPFIPHIHVENKVPEIGAVCTIVNAEEDKTKGERGPVAGKASGSGIDSLLTSALPSQSSRRDRESEKREADEVETTLQSGKALPSSGHVVVGPVITETNHSGRLLCCLCQKWANYKNLGDLYGPFYPAEYAAKLPKNQPQVRQCQATAGTNKTGPNTDTISNTLSSIQDTQAQDAYFTQSDYAIGMDSTSLAAAAGPVSTATREETMTHSAGRFSSTASSLSPSSSSSSYAISKPMSLTWDMNLDIHPIPELKREADPEMEQQWMRKQQLQLQPTPDEAQQRPQHRKLTSHPRFKRRHKSSDDCPRMVPSNSKASLPFQPPPPALDSLGPLAQLAQLPKMPMDPEELWVHEGCIVWTSGVYLVSGRLYGLQEALDGARETVSVRRTSVIISVKLKNLQPHVNLTVDLTGFNLSAPTSALTYQSLCVLSAVRTVRWSAQLWAATVKAVHFATTTFVPSKQVTMM